MTAQIIPLKTAATKKFLLAKVRQLFNEDKVWWYNAHLKTRMKERDIIMKQVLEVLRAGKLVGDPKMGDDGNWVVKISRFVAGRTVRVVVSVGDDMLRPLTVY